MELLVARNEINQKPKKIELSKIEDKVEKNGNAIFYFDRENSHKSLLDLQDHFEEKGYSFYMEEIKYGLADNEYIYQVHIIK